MSANPRQALGRLGEELAVAHLERAGFALLARNVRTRHGEIDVIAHRHETLVFVEVKTARARGGGPEPLAWYGLAQRARLRRLAAAWLRQPERHRPWAAAIRFDAIGVTVDRNDALVALEHVEGAC